jgi:hypothetical protein
VIKKKHLNIFTFLIFFSFFIYGIYNVKNYGVAHDEGGHRLVAIVNLNHIGQSLLNEKTYSEFLEKRNYPTEKIDRLKKKEYEIDNFHNNFYGAIYPIFLLSIELLLDIKDDKQIFLIRHFINFFIYFLSSISFYLLINTIFNNQSTSLAALALFIVNPRFLAESIYNTTDIILFSTCVFLFERLFSFLKKPNVNKFLLILFFSVLAVNTRVIGVTFIFIVTFILLINYRYLKNKIKINIFLFVLLYFLLSIFLSVYSFPYLWTDTSDKIQKLIFYTANHDWPGKVLYFGEVYDLKYDRLPWHYLIVWIGITIPILNIVLFFLFPINQLFNFNTSSKFLNINLIFYALIFLLSTLIYILLFILLTPKIYDGWRHFYFLNFFILFTSTFSFHFILQKKYFFKKILIVFFCFLSINNISWIINNRSSEYLYFNELSRKFINKNFELDYWGLSAKEAINKILEEEKNNTSPIKIYPIYINFNYSMKIFEKDLIKKIQIVNTIQDANYVIQNNRAEIFDLKIKNFNIFFTIKKNSINILNILKRSN